jgi:hypothetical protein
MQPGDVQTVRMYFQVNPTTAAWHRSMDAELSDGSTELLTVHRSMTVYP